MTEKGNPRIGPLDLLGQDKVWQGRQSDGELVFFRLDEMEQRHLENVRSWLMSKARYLHGAQVSGLYGFASFVGGEQASYDLDMAIGQLEEQDPQEWMREQPLFKAITRRITGRPRQGE